jgi:osmotically-inducible protein OsmY
MRATTGLTSTNDIGQEPATKQDEIALTMATRVIREVTRALRSDQRLGFADVPCRLAFEADTIEIDGDVPSIAIKRRAAEVAAAHPAVRWVIDRLRVTPSSRMSDAMIADHVADAWIEEPALTECVIRKRVKGRLEPVQNPSCARGDVCVTVDNGIVTLEGELPTRAHERLAGVLAWWVPGTRDVLYGLGVSSPEQDNDGEITDAVRAALEKDPLVDASQLRVSTTANVVTLTGLVWSGAERSMAENDAWFVFGVAGVVNDLQVADAT